MCVFCKKLMDKKNIVLENLFAAVVKDEFPVSNGHVLIIPKRHVKDFFGLTPKEEYDISTLIHECREIFEATSIEKITGWNIGWNCGESAGQTVEHAHCHLIPRRNGDIEDPTGGVRGVIPSKQNYKKPLTFL